MANKIEMNFSAAAIPLKISNSEGDIIIVSIDPITQQFNITAFAGNPIVNLKSNKEISTLNIR